MTGLRWPRTTLIWFFTSQSTIFQLCRDGSSWLEPVLSKDKCVLFKDTTQWGQWGSNPWPLVSSQALYQCAPPGIWPKAELTRIPLNYDVYLFLKMVFIFSKQCRSWWNATEVNAAFFCRSWHFIWVCTVNQRTCWMRRVRKWFVHDHVW